MSYGKSISLTWQTFATKKISKTFGPQSQSKFIHLKSIKWRSLLYTRVLQGAPPLMGHFYYGDTSIMGTPLLRWHYTPSQGCPLNSGSTVIIIAMETCYLGEVVCISLTRRSLNHLSKSTSPNKSYEASPAAVYTAEQNTNNSANLYTLL